MRITFQDITTKSDLEAPTSEDFKDISKMISQDNQKSEQKKQEILIKLQSKLKNMDFNVEKKEKFPITLQRNVAILVRIKGTLAGRILPFLLHLLKVIIILVLNLLTI